MQPPALPIKSQNNGRHFGGLWCGGSIWHSIGPENRHVGVTPALRVRVPLTPFLPPWSNGLGSRLLMPEMSGSNPPGGVYVQASSKGEDGSFLNRKFRFESGCLHPGVVLKWIKRTVCNTGIKGSNPFNASFLLR